MNDRRRIRRYLAQPSAWSGTDLAALRAEERKALALLLLWTVLVISGIWGVRVLERHAERQQEPVVVGALT